VPRLLEKPNLIFLQKKNFDFAIQIRAPNNIVLPAPKFLNKALLNSQVCLLQKISMRYFNIKFIMLGKR
jgi:hypothetical protein